MRANKKVIVILHYSEGVQLFSQERKVKSRRCAQLLLMQLKPETQMTSERFETRDSRVSVHGWMDKYKNREYHMAERINPVIHQYHFLFHFEDRYPDRRLCSSRQRINVC